MEFKMVYGAQTMTKYIHYGSPSFQPDKFQPIKNYEWGAVKPIGGMWASPIDAEWGWKQWCEAEEFWLDKLNISFELNLSDDARICHLKSVDDLKKLPERQGLFKSTWYCIDFEKAMDKYDAIELHLSEEVEDDWLGSLYFKLYGWDCDSILIMNPNIIIKRG